MGVLSGDEIERRLLAGVEGPEQIFKRETWDRGGLRGAAYDIRIATDFLILPDGTRYWPGGAAGYQHRFAPFSLSPREVAFVSSVEDLCIPFDLAGNVAPRFRWALQGLLVMGGLLVDPGYCGRLHFQLANTGDKPIEIKPQRTSVAAMQLMSVEGGDGTARDRIPSSEGLLDTLFHPQAVDPLPPLAFFSYVDELRGDVDDLVEEVDDQKIELDSTKRSTDQLVVFGVFLLSITLFTVAVAALIEALASGHVSRAAKSLSEAEVNGGLSHDGFVAAMILVVLVAVFCIAVVGTAISHIRSRRSQARVP